MCKAAFKIDIGDIDETLEAARNASMACATKMQTLLQTAYAARILVLSGRFRRGLPGSAEAARRLGVKKVLPRPFTRKELLLAVHASLEERVMRAVALRYALAPTCILLAVLVYLSPAGRTFSLAGLFVFAVLAAAWFGGAGPGLVAAVLATLTLPQLIAASYSVARRLSRSAPLHHVLRRGTCRGMGELSTSQSAARPRAICARHGRERRWLLGLDPR